MLLIDLRSPGVTVRPIRYINGSQFHVQIFFDDVRVPAENLVGDVNNGWAIAKGLLVIERLFVARVAECKAELASAARLVGPRPDHDNVELRLEHALMARRHAELDIRMRALEAAWWPAVQQAAAGGSPDLEASMLKLEGVQLLQDLHLFQIDAYGAASLPFSPEAVEGRPASRPGTTGYGANLALHMWRYRGSSLAGGSSEVQRQIIAKAIFAGQTVLGSPRSDHLSDQQAMMVNSVRRWLNSHYTFERRQNILGVQGGFDGEVWEGLRELGVAGLTIPEAFGGLGQSIEDLLPLIETLGEALLLEPMLWQAVLCTQAWVAMPESAARDALLAAMADGDMRCAMAGGGDLVQIVRCAPLSCCGKPVKGGNLTASRRW